MLPEEELKKSVLDHLFWDDRVDASRIDVEVSGGRVRLSGTVPSVSVSRAAEQDVWHVARVSDVENTLKVIKPAGPRTPSDSQLKKRVTDALKSSSSIETTHVEVEVIEGVVTVGGSVPAYSQKLYIDDLLAQLRGVSQVVNVVSVVPTGSIPDRALALRITDILGSDGSVPIESVDVTVENGVVVLSGSVFSRAVKTCIEEKVVHLLGVRGIHNQIVVEP